MTPPAPPAAGAGTETLLCSRDSGTMACIEINEATTMDEIVARWGPPLREGLTGEIMGFYLASGERLWLSVKPDEPDRLARAIVLAPAPTGTYRTLFNHLEITKTRRVDQLDFSRGVLPQDVVAAWGPPDLEGGSGIVQYLYVMEDGRDIVLVFQGDRLIWPGARRRAERRP